MDWRTLLDPVITLDRVSKTFGPVRAVDDLSLSIAGGAIHGFIGPNGAGKTTTIRMVLGIFRPDAGRIRVLGEADGLRVRDRLGYLPEEKGLYKKMRAWEVVAYFGALKGLDSKEARRRAFDLLERFGLGARAAARCESLSKGMGQKVQILATLIHEPELVILDEPFSGLDPVNVELVRETILDLKRRGRTVIFSTHVMEQAEQICDSIVLFNKGRKLLDGSLAQVKSSGDRGILLDYDGDGAFLKQLPGIRRINDAGKRAEIFLDDGVEPQSVLRAAVDRLTVRRFDIREPSLHEIFIRAVGGASDA
jgi:ABC-2 type transport system ATP-binding protein